MQSAGDRATRALVVSTVMAFGLAWALGLRDFAIIEGGVIPARLDPDFPADGLVPVLLTPMTATLLHGDLFHLAFNMVALLFCGRLVEGAIGLRGMLILYGAGAYAAAAAHVLANAGQLIPMIGASGAVSAVIAACALFYSRSEPKPIGPIPAYWVRVLWLAAAWIGINWLIGIAGFGIGGNSIAIAAHIGGFLAGLVLAKPLLLWSLRRG